MDFNLERTIEVLSRTPLTLTAMLSGLSNEWLLSNEGGETWTPYDVVGHLVFGEQTDWIERAQIILREGESRPFRPFDRFAQFELSKGKSIETLLDEFARLRSRNLQTLREMDLQSSDLEKTGIHPAFGRVTLCQLLATWMSHDLDHITQIARILAKQYAEAVGPWEQYISVLHDRRPAS